MGSYDIYYIKVMKSTYIWGAGHCGVLTAFNCEQKGIKIKGFIDIDANKIKTRLGLPVLTPEQALINVK
jgi:hypothetical protein